MPLSMKTFEEKPYNMCIDCKHIGRQCDGPNFLAMSIDRWCEWCRIRKEYLNWTNQHIADLSNVAKVSVDRVMSGNVKDIRISTMQAVTKALVNGTWGQYPCALSTLGEDVDPELPEKLEKANKEIEHLLHVIDVLNTEHKENIASVRAEDQRKIDFLRDQIKFKETQMIEKDKMIEALISTINHKGDAT